MLPSPTQSAQHAIYVFGRAVFSAASSDTYSCQSFCAFQEVYSSSQWQGWGKDSNILCPSTELNTDNDYLCFPNYPGEVNATSQSWTGVMCTPNSTVLCVSLPGWGLTGNVSVLEELVPLQDMQLVNLANNSLTGKCCHPCRLYVLCNPAGAVRPLFDNCRFLARCATCSAQQLRSWQCFSGLHLLVKQQHLWFSASCMGRCCQWLGTISSRFIPGHKSAHWPAATALVGQQFLVKPLQS